MAIFIYQYKKLFYLKLRRDDFNLFRKEQQLFYEPEHRIYEIQFERLKKLLKYSSQHVPYYKELFSKNNINVNNIKDIETFEERIPILTKHLIRKNFKKLRADNILFPPVIKNSTGGSTGEPMNFYSDRNDQSFHGAYQLIFRSWTGWRLWERTAYLWGADRDLEKHINEHFWDRFIANRLLLNSFNMTEDKIKRYFYQINEFRPKVLIGYANSLYLFARFMKKNNLTFENPTFKIQSSAEVLTKEMRKIIEQQMNTEIFDSYGSREIGSIAHECEYHSGLHLNQLIHRFEIIKEREGDKTGKVVITNFSNYIFPFIRYENGDLAEFSEEIRCKCGRTLKKISRIVGRTTDFIYTPKGKIIHGEYFTHLLYLQDFIKDFQVIQEDIENIKILYVRDDDFKDDIKLKGFLDKIKEKILKEIDDLLKVKFQEMERIPKTKTGKNKFIISKVSGKD